MTELSPTEIEAILDRIARRTHTEADLAALRQHLLFDPDRGVVQIGKYNVHIGQGQNIQIGDRIYQGADAAAIRAVIREELAELHTSALPPQERERLLANYRQDVLSETRLVNLAGIPLPRDRDGRPIPLEVPLDRVYIRIQAMPEPQQRESREKEHRALEEQARERRPFLDRLFRRESREASSLRATAADALAVLRTLGEYFYRRGKVYRAEERPDPVDPEAALREHGRLVILGAPGAGKTTLLRYLARRTAGDEEGPVPVLVSLRDYATHRGAGEHQSLQDFALDRAARGDERLRQALKEAAARGEVLWLVDALDEARGWRSEAARQGGDLPGRIVLTSRPVGYERAGLEDLPHFEVLPLTPEDTDRFLRDWFGVLAERRGAGAEWVAVRVEWLKEQLGKRPRIQPLTRNPLLLTFLVVLAGEEPIRDLPTTRAGLYRQYIHELLATWEVHRRPREGVEGQPALQLGKLEGEEARQAALEGLLRLGWRLHLTYYGGQVEELPEREALVKYLARGLKPRWGLSEGEARAVAGAVLAFWEEAGLLDHWRLGGRDYLAFRHLTFQEYAAARTLADLWAGDPGRAWRFLRPRLHHYAWQEVVLITGSLLDEDDATLLVQRIRRRRSPYERELHRDLFLAANVLGEGAPASDKEVQRLARTLGSLLAPWRRWVQIGLRTAIFLAGLFLPWEYIPWYGALIADQLWIVMWLLVWVDEIYWLRALVDLPARLFGLVSDNVRRAAAQALERMGWNPGQDESAAAFWIAKGDWERAIRLGGAA
ncbi:MAG: NACHT domain-containing protein, partial [Thermoflexia bacterium]